ncbi:MAG TPA: L-histidine N(alpha)-methyltransferase [Candidatus Binatia bacterium]|jgi:dimethylhistidine N-methyltransferase
MQKDGNTPVFSADQRKLWVRADGSIWTLADGAAADDPSVSVMRTMWDQPRWLEAYHLYDDRGSALFEEICELPEYYLTRTENAILAEQSQRIIAAAPVQCIVELGAGSARKTTHLLQAQMTQRGGGIFAPIDVSLPGLIQSRDFVRANFPGIAFHGLHARYEEGFSNINRSLPILYVFLGSTIGNFNPSSFVRFFSQLSNAMGSDDFLLLGIDRLKDARVLEAAYADSRGVTAEFILNAFVVINRLTAANFDLAKMIYQSRFNPELGQIEMHAVAAETQKIVFASFDASFEWRKGERILVEISRKFDPARVQQQLRFFDLEPVGHFTDAREWFSLLLFKKK